MGKKKNRHSRNKSSDENKHTATTCEEKKVPAGDSKIDLDIEADVRILNTINIPVVVDKELDGQSKIYFETYNPNSQRVTGREYFIHSLCQVCKQDPLERVLCPKCLLVIYCCHDHRRQHWPSHAELCSAIVEVCKERQVNHIMQGALNYSSEKFRLFRFQNMVECENKVERPLEKWEKEIFIFPNVCGRCHEFNQQVLIICNHCHHSSFCQGHQMENHNEWCQHILRYKNILKDQNKFGIPCPTIPISKNLLSLPQLLDIEHFFKSILGSIDEFEFLELTEITTYPLTTLEALLSTSKEQLFNSKKLILHVVGAEPEFEVNKLEKWEHYILHLIPNLQSLEIDFVGPELNSTLKSGVFKACAQCIAANKSINFRFHNQLYHTFSKNPHSSKPNLVGVFNPGLYRATGFNGEDTWSSTITSMFDNECPVLITAYTCKEIFLDLDRVKSTQQIRLEREPTLNPFSSLKPSLNFVSEEDSPVIFKNLYYCVMCRKNIQS